MDGDRGPDGLTSQIYIVLQFCIVPDGTRSEGGTSSLVVATAAGLNRGEHSRGFKMIRTITVGSCISVQGKFERELENGRIVVSVGEQTYAGRPVTR